MVAQNAGDFDLLLVCKLQGSPRNLEPSPAAFGLNLALTPALALAPALTLALTNPDPNPEP